MGEAPQARKNKLELELDCNNIIRQIQSKIYTK